MVLGGGIVANGWIQTSVGISEIIGGLFSNGESGRDKTSVVNDIPKTLTEVVAVPIDMTIQLVTGEESDNAQKVAETIDKIEPLPNTVLELLLQPSPAY